MLDLNGHSYGVGVTQCILGAQRTREERREQVPALFRRIGEEKHHEEK